MEIEYMKHGDYYLPNLVFDGFVSDSQLGKYGRLRKRYLKENFKVEYTILLMEGNLYKHLLGTQELATNKVNALIRQLAKQENINEELKSIEQLKWVQSMNNIKNRAEEMVIKEVVYEEL